MRRLFSTLFLIVVVLAGACQPAPRDPTSLPHSSSQHLIVLPDDGPEQVLALIDGAQKSVRFKIYLLTHEEIIAALVRASNRGVDVRVLIEQNPVGGGESNQRTSDRLQQGGVNVRWAPSLYELTHEKSLLVDDSRVLVGTFNYTASSFNANREYGLLIDDPALVDEIAAIFDADWAGKLYQRAPHPALVVSPLNSRQQIESMIDGAQKTLWLEEATLLDDAIAGRLAAAAARGVDVRFLGALRSDEEDLSEPNYLQLQAAGIQVARLPDPIVHAKLILADGRRALVGSINLTRASIDHNRELGIVTEDAAAIARMQKTFESDWQRALHVAPTPTGVISWQEAGQYVGAEVTVEGEILRTYDTGKVTFLNFTPNYRGTLSLVIFAAGAAEYPAPPDQYFLNQRVRVRGRVKEYQGAPEIILDSPDQIEILPAVRSGVDLTATTDEAANVSPAATETVTPGTTAPVLAATPSIVAWQDAGKHIGQQIVVEGEVVRTHDTGNVTFLNFTNDWRGTFSVVIFASNYDKFPQPPHELFRNKSIRVKGRVKEYQGAPEIVVESPNDIQIVQPAGTASPTSTATPAPVAAGVIPWEQAGAYLGQTITVSGRIVRTHDAGSITFLNFSPEPGQFVAVVFAADYPVFPVLPAKLYEDKTVWVTGEIGQYNGVPQIIISSPQQIEVFP